LGIQARRQGRDRGDLQAAEGCLVEHPFQISLVAASQKITVVIDNDLRAPRKNSVVERCVRVIRLT
jgi:hypothetical protein